MGNNSFDTFVHPFAIIAFVTKKERKVEEFKFYLMEVWRLVFLIENHKTYIC